MVSPSVLVYGENVGGAERRVGGTSGVFVGSTGFVFGPLLMDRRLDDIVFGPGDIVGGPAHIVFGPDEI